MPNETETKWGLRRLLREQRLGIPATIRQQSALAAARILVAHPLFQASHHIACYMAQPAEFDTTPFFALMEQAQQSCYLPVITQATTKTLLFCRYKTGDRLIENRVGILEPDLGVSHPYPAHQLDLVILPLLGFDERGYRLGTGGGYYDRTFSFLKQARVKKPYLLGLGYEQQGVVSLPTEAWDLPLDGVLTESTWHNFSE